MNRHGSFEGDGFDIKKFCAELEEFRTKHGLATPSESPFYGSPRGDYAFALSANTSGYHVEDNTDVDITGFRGRVYKVVRLTKTWPHLIGVSEENGKQLDYCQRSVRLCLAALAKGPSQREISVLPGLPCVDHIQNNTTIVCIVCIQEAWITTTLRATKVGDRLNISELIIFDPVQQPLDQAALMYNRIKAEIGKTYPLAQDMVSYAWPVEKLNPDARHHSGVHAVCQALSLMERGHAWVGELSEHVVTEMRHFFLRAITRKLTQAVRRKDIE